MSEPRFVVSSVTGYSIAIGGGTTRKPMTIWLVHDRIYNYRTIAAIPAHATTGMPIAVRETRAHELAHELNVQHEAWLREQPT